MAGPEVYDLSEARRAPVCLTPEGYNVWNLVEARAYLTEVWHRELPEPENELDRLTGYHVSHALQFVERAALHESGRHQNDAEHASTAANLALDIGGRLHPPDVNVYRASALLVIHDNLEVYSGDTHIFDDEGLKTKDWREEAAATILRDEWSDNPEKLALLDEWVDCNSATSLFAHAIDGLDPVMQAIKSKCAVQRERHDDYHEMLEKVLTKTSLHPMVFAITIDAVKQLGYMWQENGCKPFDCDPGEIVDQVVDTIIKRKLIASAAKLPYTQRIHQPKLAPADNVRHLNTLPQEPVHSA